MRRISLTVALIPLLCALDARAGFDEVAPLLGQSVRLTREAMGCGTVAGPLRIANITVRQRGAVSLAQMAEHDCRLFKSFHGEVADRKDGAVCVLGIGNSRCLWFAAGSFEQARRM